MLNVWIFVSAKHLSVHCRFHKKVRAMKVDAKMDFLGSSKTLSFFHGAYPFERQAARTWLFLHQSIKRNHVRTAFNPLANTDMTLLSNLFAEYLSITSWPSLAPHMLHLSTIHAIMFDSEDLPSAAWDKEPACSCSTPGSFEDIELNTCFLGL